jgi:ribosomal protein L11 methyltransferase
VDEALAKEMENLSQVRLYLEEPSAPADLERLRDLLERLPKRFPNCDFGPLTLALEALPEEDWANSWKEYYKPLRIGKRLVIVPAWEKYEAEADDLIVRMDPGMAFGTGTHETTRLVIQLLEKYTQAGCRMLDVGTGSGILAICASKLGAAECFAYDIDPMAVRVANENIKDSGLKNITCEVSDLLRQADRTRPYDLICANIVADIIIRMTPDVAPFMHEKTVLLASGIISERADDVINCFEANGFRIVERVEENGWCALAVMKA